MKKILYILIGIVTVFAGLLGLLISKIQRK